MNTPLAWLNLVHQKKRSLVAILGVGFAALLVFMQLGFYGAAEASATIIYDELAFDIVLLSPQYIDLNRAGTFPAERLHQAAGVGGVADVTPVLVSFGSWRNPDAPPQYASRPQTIMLLGFRPDDVVFRPGSKGVAEAVEQNRGELQKPGKALIDRMSHAEFGNFAPGASVEVGPQRVEIVGQFTLGTGFGANGLVLVSDLTFYRVWRTFPANRTSVGLVRLAAGADAADVARRLNEVLPKDVRALTAAELSAREREHWVQGTSLGLIFQFGVGVAVFVGIIFVYQVIASDIANRLHEYATLKAMGYGPGYLSAVVLQQALLIAGLGYVPGLLGSLALYGLTAGATGTPIAMTLTRAALVLALTVGMCSISGVLALRKVQSADPAELF